ncbi:hypothetical protein QTP88_002229 [Uroleucon formosanum]
MSFYLVVIEPNNNSCLPHYSHSGTLCPKCGVSVILKVENQLHLTSAVLDLDYGSVNRPTWPVIREMLYIKKTFTTHVRRIYKHEDYSKTNCKWKNGKMVEENKVSFEYPCKLHGLDLVTTTITYYMRMRKKNNNKSLHLKYDSDSRRNCHVKKATLTCPGPKTLINKNQPINLCESKRVANYQPAEYQSL